LYLKVDQVKGNFLHISADGAAYLVAGSNQPKLVTGGGGNACKGGLGIGRSHRELLKQMIIKLYMAKPITPGKKLSYAAFPRTRRDTQIVDML